MKRVVVTRAPHQAGKLADMLRERGMAPLLFPCIDIALPEDTTQLDEVLRNTRAFDWLVVTSANTVIALERRMDALGVPCDDLQALKIAAVGCKTAKSAEKRLGVTVDVLPEKQVAEGLVAAMPDVRGQRIFLPQSEIAREVLADLLTKAGAEVTYVVAYRTVTGTGGVGLADVRSADAVTFTSPSTVRGFVERCGGLIDLPALCIGPVTSKAARDAGFTQIFEPDENYSLEGMLGAYDDTR